VSAFASTLVKWQRAHGRRDLPWQNTRDPYRVWLSEVMLQQTQVAAVLGYYHRFLSAFPSLKALAEASESEVLAAWSGLGYYRRARMLHAAAKTVFFERKGKYPGSSAEWLALPGIGRYTAAAIASITRGERTAVVDGNVERVLWRLYGSQEIDCWKTANALLAPGSPADFNQAMMELGATVCLPKNPACDQCPVERWCATRGEHAAVKPPARLKRTLSFGLARRNGSVYLVQRPSEASLMAGMWELPSAKSSAKTLLLATRHSITVADYKVTVYAASRDVVANGRWVKLAEVESLPLTGLTRKVLRKLELIR